MQNISIHGKWISPKTSKHSVIPSRVLLTGGSSKGLVTIPASKGPLSASVQLTVSSTVVLNSITVTPGNQHKLLGSGTVTYTATGNFSDDSTQDLTGTVTWASSVPGVATMTNNVATLVAAGTTAISATSTAGPTVTGSTSLQVIVLSSITVTPASQAVVVNACPVTDTPTGHYSDGSTQNFTGSATWSSSNTGVATMTNNVATPTGT